jgi:alpha-galactosidase
LAREGLSRRTIEAAWSDRDVRVEEFEHEVWRRARPAHLRRLWSGEEAPAEQHAEARLAWCEGGLVALFRCRQAGPLVVAEAPQLERKTIGLWNRDVCEIFVAPDPAQPERYFEFEAAPTGEWLDLAINWRPDERETDWDYASGMRVAARVAASEVTIAMRLPWTAFGCRPEASDEWRCNLFRCVGPHPRLRYLAWLPTHTPEPQFHIPSAFGLLRFAKA